MELTAQEFLSEAGMDETMAPGMIKYRKVAGHKEGTSYTVVYDWHTDLNKIRVEVRPGLSGQLPSRKDLKNYEVWLQSENFIEFNIKKDTKH